MRWIARALALPLLLIATGDAGAQSEPQRFPVAVLKQMPEEPAWVTAFTRPPQDDGIAGARLAIEDNATTGRFMGQEFSLAEEVVPFGEDPLPAFERLVEGGALYVVLDVPADDLLRIADAAPDDLVLFNAGAADDRLRNEECRANLFHTAPSRAMLTDALAQYLISKRWQDWLLISGQRERDQLYAAALKRSAEKFGARIVEEREWDFGPDMRRTAQSTVPVFTQNVSYDIAVLADELAEFGDLILYRTWDPRPTAGTQGLTPSAWHPAIEAYGAVQLQNRFIKLNQRRMGGLDYQYWAAVRAIGEAATVARTDDPAAIRERLKSDEFEMAGFKGVGLSFRGWDLQLRQPIPLAHPAAFVILAPMEGFLHQRTPLDTLGTDEPETACQF